MPTNRAGFRQYRNPARKAGTFVPTSGLGINQILNADFSNGFTFWTPGTGWSVGSFAATHAPGTGSSLTSQSPGAVIGLVYTIFYHMAVTAGTFTLSFGGVSDTPRTTNGDFQITLTALSNAPLSILSDAAGNGSISELRVQRVFFT